MRKSDDDGSDERKAILPRSHKKVNQGEKVNASERQKRTFSSSERPIKPNKRRKHPIVHATVGENQSL